MDKCKGCNCDVTKDHSLVDGLCDTCLDKENTKELKWMSDEDDVNMMIAFRGEHWDLWEKFCKEAGVHPELQPIYPCDKCHDYSYDEKDIVNGLCKKCR